MNKANHHYALVKILTTGETIVIQEVYSPKIRPDIDMFDLKCLQDSVGGYFEIVPTGKIDRVMLANEDGLMLKYSLNVLASSMAGMKLVGDVGLIRKTI